MAKQTLASKPRLLLDPRRGGVLRVGVGEDAQQLLITLEGEIDQGRQRLGADPLPPALAGDPVAHLVDVSKLATTQIDRPDQQIAVSFGDGIDLGPPVLAQIVMGRNPLTGGIIGIRVGNRASGAGQFLIARNLTTI